MIPRILFASGTVLLLAGCAYTPLKAPCSPDDGAPPGLGSVMTPLSYAEAHSTLTDPFRSRAPSPGQAGPGDACGPMRAI